MNDLDLVGIGGPEDVLEHDDAQWQGLWEWVSLGMVPVEGPGEGFYAVGGDLEKRKYADRRNPSPPPGPTEQGSVLGSPRPSENLVSGCQTGSWPKKTSPSEREGIDGGYDRWGMGGKKLLAGEYVGALGPLVAPYARNSPSWHTTKSLTNALTA